ncbi:MAG: DUF4281 domain-containing protein [Ferruginibacter sp.]|nr:DUF4281 domain-containing protein [Cytophagales bacterium]
MNPDLLFTVCNNAALVGWLLLVFAPRWKYTRPAIFSGLILGFAALYILFIASSFGKTPGGGFGSLEQVARLFSNPVALLAGWVHYLAFDLLVGCWISADARRAGVAHLATVPCLLLTFMFGPTGLLLYRLVRLYKKPTFFIDIHENAA